MRRKDRQIEDKNEIIAIMKKCNICSLAFFDEEYPYIIPVNFGVTEEDGGICLYFHGAGQGKKIDLMNKCNKVSFTMSCGHEITEGPRACNYSIRFESVCGNGSLEMVEDYEQKSAALVALMKQYSELDFEFSERDVKGVTVLRLRVNEISGKRRQK